MEFTLRNAAAGLDQSIGQSRFAVIDVRDDAKIPDMFHAVFDLGFCGGDCV